MPARKHTNEQIEEALRIYKEHGAAEAASQTGIKQVTISTWARRKGVQSDAPENLRAAHEMAVLTRQQRQDRLIDMAIDEAEAALRDHRQEFKMVIPKKSVTPRS